MPRKSNSRAAQGAGTIRKKTVTRKGTAYTYWEARITTGYDSGTGKQIQRSFSGKTQKEVREKMQAIAIELNNGTYKEPLKMTVGEWLDIWAKDYLNNVKPRTREIYEASIRNHLKPALGTIRLEALDTPTIQAFYNGLSSPCKTRDHALSPKTIKDLHGILHKALNQAAAIGYLRFNPADACNIPKAVRKELTPLDTEDIQKFLTEIRGNPSEILLSVTLFMGLREGEVLALSQHNIDFEHGTVLINCQLQRFCEDKGVYRMVPTKNSKGRTIKPATAVMDLLKRQKAIQAEMRLKAGTAWENADFIFTNECGHHFDNSTIYRAFKKATTAIGRPDARFHDLRHSYAVAAIQSGDDIKTVQSNLGYATAAFTLDVYGHVTEQMKQASSERMDNFIKSVSGGEK